MPQIGNSAGLFSMMMLWVGISYIMINPVLKNIKIIEKYGLKKYTKKNRKLTTRKTTTFQKNFMYLTARIKHGLKLNGHFWI